MTRRWSTTAATWRAGATAPRSTASRSGPVTGTPRSQTGRRSLSTLGRWRRMPGSRPERARSPTVTSTSSAGRSAPHRRAAVTCEPIAPRPTASTAARARCSSERGELTTRATPGNTGSSWPPLSRRPHAAGLSPASSAWARVTSPCCRRANAPIRRSASRMPAIIPASCDSEALGRDLACQASRSAPKAPWRRQCPHRGAPGRAVRRPRSPFGRDVARQASRSAPKRGAGAGVRPAPPRPAGAWPAGARWRRPRTTRARTTPPGCGRCHPDRG